MSSNIFIHFYGKFCTSNPLLNSLYCQLCHKQFSNVNFDSIISENFEMKNSLLIWKKGLTHKWSFAQSILTTKMYDNANNFRSRSFSNDITVANFSIIFEQLAWFLLFYPKLKSRLFIALIFFYVGLLLFCHLPSCHWTLVFFIASTSYIRISFSSVFFRAITSVQLRHETFFAMCKNHTYFSVIQVVKL